MNCERCGREITPGQEMRHQGRTLCEDCCMDVLSPAKACDPWAVYTARSFSGSGAVLSSRQTEILRLLAETGGMEFPELAERLGLSPADLERELATLRHMEKTRATMRDNRKIICLW